MIDAHCHLAGEEFATDLPEVVARARAGGVERALVVLAEGTAEERARAAQVRDLWPAVLFAAGVTPHDAASPAAAEDVLIAGVAAALDACQAVAVGEIGLEYHYDVAPHDVQQRVFRAQVRLARERALPIVIHTREARDDTFRVLREEGGGAVRGMFHCFTGNADMAREAVDLGFHVSFAGILTYHNADALREAAAVVPLDRLLAETDAPYLVPRPHRGKVKRNEPLYVTYVYETLAGIHGVPPPAVEARLAANFTALFGA